MTKDFILPEYIFESSWEVCNKVGGIYTVLSTRAKTLQDMLNDKVIFIGPDFKESSNQCFTEDNTLFSEWKAKASEDGLTVRVGRWNVPGNPIAILVDFNPYFSKKNEIYTWLWEHYQVDSLHAYGDYDEASMFSYAAALVVESYYHFYLEGNKRVIYHGNEWMLGLGVLYINNKLPQVATVFTTHATSIGRSIAGNNKPLYDYLFAYNGDQMADELNMQSKHSIEKQTAKHVDCFTTVSDITANECKELLDKPVDFVLPNGFEDGFVPKGAAFTKKRKAARKMVLNVANALLGTSLDDDTLIVSTSGRYEFRNKGIDVYIEAMNRLLRDNRLNKTVLAFIEVPGWVGEPRQDLIDRLQNGGNYDTALPVPLITHWLHNMSHDKTLDMLKYLDMQNRYEDKVKLINPGFQITYRIIYKDAFEADVTCLRGDATSRRIENCEELYLQDEYDETKNRTYPAGSYKWKILQEEVMKEGKIIAKERTLEQKRAYYFENLYSFNETERRIINPHYYKVDISDELYDLKLNLINKIIGEIKELKRR